MRYGIQRERNGGSVDDMELKIQVCKGRGEEHQSRDTRKEMQHRIGIAKSLEEAQSRARQGIVEPEYLCHTARPANSLLDVAREAFRGQATRQHAAQICGRVSFSMQFERSVRIFSHGFHSDAPDLFQGGAPQHRTRAAEECGIPQIIAVLDQSVEQVALIRYLSKRAEVALEWIRREEVMRSLHQGALRIACEPSHRRGQKAAYRDVIAIENCDKFALGNAERVIEVARLGVGVVGTDDVLGTALGSELAKPQMIAIVEDIYIQLVGRPVETERGQHRRLHHVE